MASRRVVLELEVVWCGSHRTPLAGDYTRYPDYTSAIAPIHLERRAGRKRQLASHPCACGCGRLVPHHTTWARGHHAGRRHQRGETP